MSSSAECRALHRYLAGAAPDAYVLAKYAEACAKLSDKLAPGSSFDSFLSRVASRHALLMALVQSYARLFMPRALVRRKAVLVLAIVECNPRTLHIVQQTAGYSRLQVVMAGIAYLAGFSLRLVLATMTLGPLHLLYRIVSRASAREAQLQPASGEQP